MQFNIKNKLLLMLVLILILFSLATYIILEISFYQTNELLNRSINDQMLFSTAIVESELRKVEEMSSFIMSDSVIQNTLDDLDNMDIKLPAYKMHREINNLYGQLYYYLPTAHYIAAIHVFDNVGYNYVVGYDRQAFDSELKQSVLLNAREKNGAHIWISSSDRQQYLISARSILKIAKMSFNELGVISIVVDLEKLVRYSISAFSKLSVDLTILMSGDAIFMTNPDFNLENIINFDSKKGFEIRNINHEKYFLSYVKSDYIDLIYVCILSYENVYNKRKILMSRIVPFTGFTLFLIIFIFGRSLVKKITEPIIDLASAMKDVERNDFSVGKINLKRREEKDEIGILYREFNIMVKKLHTLINENYKKQIIIKDAQFQTLQSQINPHFLYNTLESINWIATANKQRKIARMIKSLGTLLRTSISKKKAIITIDEELVLLNHYLAIQKIRYENRLEVNYNIEDEIKSFAIPKLVLQPIVENSIKYGLEMLKGICKIYIYGKKENDTIRLVIEDNGKYMNSELKERSSKKVEKDNLGLGLKNIDERVALVFGDNYGLSIVSRENKGTQVTLTIKACKISEIGNWTKENN